MTDIYRELRAAPRVDIFRTLDPRFATPPTMAALFSATHSHAVAQVAGAATPTKVVAAVTDSVSKLVSKSHSAR